MKNLPTWKDWREWVKKVDPNLAMVVLGIILMIVGMSINAYKQKHLEQSLAQATESIAQAEVVLISTQDEFTTTSRWFVQKFTEEAQQKLTEARSKIGNEDESGAKKLLADALALNDWDKSTAMAAEAITLAQQAKDLIAEAQGTLNALVVQRAQTRTALEEANRKQAIQLSTLEAVENRLKNEEQQYLSKYTVPLYETVTSAEESAAQSAKALSAALSYVPEDGSVSQTGNLTMAQGEIDAAHAAITRLATFAQQVSTSLDYQAEADKLAASVATTATEEISAVAGYLTNLETARGFSPELALKGSYESLALAREKLSNANKVLATVIERSLTDKPAAYEAGKSARTYAAQSVASANAQVAFADTAARLIAQYPVHLSVADDALTVIRSTHQGLAAYHAGSAWQVQSTYVSSSESSRAQAESLITSARIKSSLEKQQFEASQTDAQAAHASLDEIEHMAADIAERLTLLEGFRSSWTQAESTARTAIANAESAINSLNWSYNMNQAQGSLNTATSQLSQARSYAASLDWQNAVAQANAATNSANTATNQAWAEKQRADAAATAVSVQATREEEVRNDRATEVAASATRTAQILENSRSNDYGSSSSSSGSCCSSSSSDSGSWNSGGSDSGSWNSGGNDNGAWDD